MHYALSLIVALVATIVFLVFMIKPAIKLGVVDYPGGIKRHSHPVPLIGGVCIFLGFCVACLTLRMSLVKYDSLFVGGLLLVIIGLCDDKFQLSPMFRLLAQILAALLMVFFGKIYLAQFGDFFHLANLDLGGWGIPLTILAVVCLINAMNMLDGIDGLAGSIACTQLVFLFYFSIRAHRMGDFEILGLILVSSFAFLLFNFPRKNWRVKLFLGDAGSMWLGFVLTWFCVSLSQKPAIAANPATFIWIMAIPLFDISCIVIKRLLQRKSPLKGDRQHVHHILLGFGLSHLQVIIVINAISFALGLFGVILNHFAVPGYISTTLFVACFSGYFAVNSYYHRKLNGLGTDF